MSSKNSSLSPKKERTLPSSSSSESTADVLMSSKGTRSLAEMRDLSDICSESSKHSSRLPNELRAAGLDHTAWREGEEEEERRGEGSRNAGCG